ncbi:hypothetical protein GW17_00006865 [Ensete ventricosum]|nr:hypothetical protein GW17_00006865 [Ensete ventricosum]
MTRFCPSVQVCPCWLEWERYSAEVGGARSGAWLGLAPSVRGFALGGVWPRGLPRSSSAASVSDDAVCCVLPSSSSSSSVGRPLLRQVGRRCENPEASTSGTSSGIPSPVRAKALRDLEVVKECHDFDSAVTDGSLAAIWERYSIPEEYALHAPLLEQRPYNPGSPGLSILVDALEAGLRFPLHPIIEECLG